MTELSPPSTDVLASLRAATAERHATLDRSMPLSHAAPSLADYRDHLLILRAWLAPLERWLASFGDGPQDPALLAPITRMPELNADLSHPATPAGGTPVRDFDVTPLRREPAFRWGVCYVIEGSQLGGAVLYRQLAGRLAPHPLHYLGAGQSPGPRWQQFLHALRASVREPADIALACAGAQAAFDALLDRVPAIAPAAPGTL
ncbi:biliverdin-producing heme oxygenase [Cupriavidus sp. SZY C1]|uniref:biliverdin-producing heme oxygenase n=1 Tax=Cupriavidus sp. SZY C1 TaxID=3055037 RepID=UPI0028B7B7A3|nr:biliverdin-producing heme oxygenase [Cupriavidus sp. SZY C1]MDT6963384.1 biliverdin-producing heme oxygenase [Cupriavidus sp. SZY C1]